MMKVIAFGIICILMLVTIPIGVSENISDYESVSKDRKHIVYISGTGLTEVMCYDDCSIGPYGHLFRFYGFEKSYARFFFRASDDIKVFILDNTKPNIIKRPVSIELDLSEEDTFALLYWSYRSPSFRSRVIGVCNSVSIKFI